MYYQPARGIRKSSAIITVAAAATPEDLYLIGTGSTVGRTLILRKIMAYNAVAATTLDIGINLGGLFANVIPTLHLVNNMDNEWQEVEIPEVEVNANLTVQTDVLGVQVQVEVEVIGS